LFILDLISHKNPAESQRRRLLWAVIWVAAGLSFWSFVWTSGTTDDANRHLTAYLIEQTLSIDNLFVFLLIFKSLNLSLRLQRTALTWGILEH